MAAQIEKIKAEERTQRINDAAVSSGALSKKDARQHMDELEQMASGRKREVQKASRDLLIAAGIGVRTP